MKFTRNFTSFLIVCCIVLFNLSSVIPIFNAEVGTIEITPVEDTYISSLLHFENFGAEDKLLLTEEQRDLYYPMGWYIREILLKFDLSSVSVDLDILSAKIYLYCNDYNQSSVSFQAYHCSSNEWSEYTVDFMSYQLNLFSNLYATGSEEVTVNAQDEWYVVDVTEDIEDFIPGTLTEMLNISQEWIQHSVAFSSREGANPPYLELSFTKYDSSITCQSSESTIGLGNTTIISGEITPQFIGENITLQYQNNETILETFVATDTSGSYLATFLPTIAGTWNITAEWAGTEYYESASAKTTVSVTAPPQPPEEPGEPEEPEQPELPQTEIGVLVIVGIVIGSAVLIALVPFIVSSRTRE